MNREIINKILDDVESAMAAFASGAINAAAYADQQRVLNARLNVYGLALASVAVTPPF